VASEKKYCVREKRAMKKKKKIGQREPKTPSPSSEKRENAESGPGMGKKGAHRGQKKDAPKRKEEIRSKSAPKNRPTKKI